MGHQGIEFKRSIGFDRAVFGERVGVVDGPLDDVGDGDVESLREGVEIELGVVVFFVIPGVVGVGVGVGELEFGDGGEDCVD